MALVAASHVGVPIIASVRVLLADDATSGVLWAA